MKLAKGMKKYIALLLAVCMVGAMTCYDFAVKKVQAAETAPTDDVFETVPLTKLGYTESVSLNGAGKWFSSQTSSATLDGIAIEGQYNFTATSANPYICYGGTTNRWLGVRVIVTTTGALQIRVADGTKDVALVDPNTGADVTQANEMTVALLGQNLKIRTGFQFYNTTSTTTDVKITTTIEAAASGITYTTTRTATGIALSALGRGCYVEAPSGSTAVVTNIERMPDTLRKMNLSDWCFSGNSYTVAADAAAPTFLKPTFTSAYPAPTTLANVVTTMKIKFEGASSFVQYAIPSGYSDWYGVSVQLMQSTGDATSYYLQITSAENYYFTGTYVCNPWEVGLSNSFKDVEFDLSFSMELYDADGDGADDIRLGVWVNGNLCRQYIPCIDAKTKVAGASMGFIVNAFAGLSATESGTITIRNTDVECDNFGLITPTDFGVAAAEYTCNPGAFCTNSIGTAPAGLTSLDGKMFSSNVRFNMYDSQIYYGAPARGNWVALRIGNFSNQGQTSLTSGTEYNVRKFMIQHPENKIAKKEFDASIAGVQLANDTFNLKISTRKVDSDGDGAVDDLELGIWFNGTLYDNSYIYTANQGDLLKPNFSVYCSENRGCVALGDITQTTANTEEYCADDKAYFIGADTATVNGTTYDRSVTLDASGEYDITYKDGNSTFKRNVVIWKTNDVKADGFIDIKDMLVHKKYESNVRTLSRAEELGKGTSTYSSLRAELLKNYTDAASLNKLGVADLSTSILGVTGSQSSTGANTYITDIGKTKEGTAIISVSDTETAGYTALPSNFDESGLDYVLDFDTDRPIRVLQITDPQIIDSSQMRFDTRLNSWSVAPWAPDQMDNVLFNEMDKLIADTKPDLILVTGDIIYGEFDDKGTSTAAYIAKMESYKIPWAPFYGNHDNETHLGVDWQNQQYINAPYCLFNPRQSVGGNGNYSIGIAVQGKLQRTICMLDSHGNANGNEGAYPCRPGHQAIRDIAVFVAVSDSGCAPAHLA